MSLQWPRKWSGHQTRATVWSFALHTLIGLSVVGAGSWAPPDPPKPVVIDLDIAILPAPVELGSPAPPLGPPAGPPSQGVSAARAAPKAPPRPEPAKARRQGLKPDSQPPLPTPRSEVADKEDMERSTEEEILEQSDLGTPVEPAPPAASGIVGSDADEAGETGSGEESPDGVLGGVLGGIAGGAPGGVPGGVPGGIPGGIPGGTGKADGMGRFSALIWSKIEKARFYPRPARRQGLEGVVGIRFLILPNGRVDEISVIQPSPHDILNEAAQETIARAAPFHHRPKELDGEVLVMQIAIAFKLE